MLLHEEEEDEEEGLTEKLYAYALAQMKIQVPNCYGY